MSAATLHSLFAPAAVAIAGISSRAGTFRIGGRAVLDHLRRHGFDGDIALSSTSRLAGDLPPAGDVGVIVQSGALGSGFLDQAAREHIGLSHLISTGNEALTGLNDCLRQPAGRVSTAARFYPGAGVRETVDPPAIL